MRHELRKLRASFHAAWCGVLQATRGERNFRIHISITFYVIAFALIGRLSSTSIGILCICVGLVMGAELFNTAIEMLCDLITQRFDKTLGAIKDLSAAAVLFCALAAATCGLCIFLSPSVLNNIWYSLTYYIWLVPAVIFTIPFALWFIFHKRT